ncbi:MAG TPA: rod shape-determining protein MreD [Candidatus Dormibacteraeota bacterium]
MLLAQGALLLTAVLVQVSVVGRLDPALPQPNLVLALVLARAWLRGGRAALPWSVAGGLLLDLAGTGPLGTHALALVAAAYLGGALAAWVGNARPAGIAVLAGAAGGAVYGAVVLALADFLGLAQVSARAALPLVLLNALPVSVLVPILAALWERLHGTRAVGLPSWHHPTKSAISRGPR